MRICTQCKEEKELNRENFHYKNKEKNLFNYICIPCWKTYHKSHYNDNKDKYILKANVLRRELTDTNTLQILQYLESHPCVDCGESDPIVLEFDHVRGKKSYNISSRLTQVSWDKVEDEIRKCDVRCANCHRRKTAKQFGYTKYVQSIDKMRDRC